MREKFDSILGKVREKDEGKGGGGETLPEWIVDDCNSKEIATINGILANNKTLTSRSNHGKAVF